MPTVLPLALGAALLLPDALAAQRDTMHVHAMPRRDSVSVMLTALGTRVAPALGGMARSEGLVTQPMLSARGAHGRFRYAVMLNAERWTMPDGEPVAGIWGEGFIDRRHPHTVVHEVMLTAEQRIQGMHVSVAGGKGVVPFGTDDPMIRPFTKYPANHHLMQVLERVQLAAAVRLGATAVLDAAVFNGDEPSSPTAAPIWTRFADSRAVRLTVWVTPVLEVQGSVASVRSPEFASGDGLDHAKQSASARWTPAHGALRYVLLEWGRTGERYRDRAIIDYGTLLGEASASRGRMGVAVRVERTTRPEEERLLDPFRTARPPADLTIKGLTRWTLGSMQLSTQLPPLVEWVHGVMFVEGTWARSTPLLRPVLLDPRDISGASAAWHLSLGMRVGAGAMPLRVGRYGVAAGAARTNVGFMTAHTHRSAP